VNGDTLVSIGVSPSLSTAATTTSPVASYAISISGSASTTNYAITYVSGTLMVTQAGMTITADNQSRAYGAGNPSLTVTPTGLVNGDTLVSIVVTPALTTIALTTTGVGSYPISISGPASTINYAISYLGGTLTITAAGTSVTVSALPEPSTAGSIDTLSATVATTVAGGINPNTEGTVTFSEAGTTLCTTGTLSGNTASCTNNAFLAGTHTITATYNPSANFLTGSSTNFHLVS
jgi:hypothetical protein